MALVVAVTAGAQTGLVEFPYNPDADQDDIIGTVDLLALLSLYGSEFDEEELYVNDSETAALYHTGVQAFAMCKATCSDLPGNWRMIDMGDWAKFHNEIASTESVNNGFAWLDEKATITATTTYPLLAVARNAEFGWEKGQLTFLSLYDATHCFCVLHERPKVEYSYCRTNEASEFTTCCNEKVADGWYPLSATTGVSGSVYAGGEKFGQAFWRWAE